MTVTTSKLNLNKIIKRFYPGGKETGHARKILKVINKIPLSSQAMIPSSKSSFPTQENQTPPANTVPTQKTFMQVQNDAANASIKNANKHKEFAANKQKNILPQPKKEDIKSNQEEMKQPGHIAFTLEMKLNNNNDVQDIEINLPWASIPILPPPLPLIKTNEVTDKKILVNSNLTLQEELRKVIIEREKRQDLIQEKFEQLEHNIELKKHIQRLTDEDYPHMLEYFKKKKETLNQQPNNIKSQEQYNNELQTFCKEVFDKDLKIDNQIISPQKQQLLYIITEQYSEQPWAELVSNYILKSPKKVLLTVEDLKNKISYVEEGCLILSKYGLLLPENIHLEIIKLQGVLVNNDAQYTKNNIGPLDTQNFIYDEIKVQPEGEGYTLHSRCYEIMRKNREKYFIVDREPLTKDEFRQMQKKILCGEYNAKKVDLKPTTVRNFYPDAMLASGDLIHIMICVTLKNKFDQSFTIGFNSLTSAKDAGAVSFGCKQIINDDPKQQLKDQNCRPFDQLITVSKHMKEDSKATTFITSTDYDGTGLLNQRKIILHEFEKKIPYLEKMPIRKMQEITRPFLQALANDMILEDIEKLKEDQRNLEQQLLNLSPIKKEVFLKQRDNLMKKNLRIEHEREFTKKSSKAFQEIIKMRNKSEDNLNKDKRLHQILNKNENKGTE